MTTRPNLFTPPPKANLPLSLGGDLLVDFRNNPSGDGATFANWDTGVTVTLVIDTSPQIAQPATISTYHAVVQVASTICDMVPNSTAWRLLVDVPSPAAQIVAVNGRVVRSD